MQRFILALFFLASGLLACQKNKAAPPRCDEQYVSIPLDTSYLSTPLVIPTQLIEDKINSTLGQVIKNDQDFDNLDKEGKKDKTKIKVTRLGDVQIHWKNHFFYSSFIEGVSSEFHARTSKISLYIDDLYFLLKIDYNFYY